MYFFGFGFLVFLCVFHATDCSSSGYVSVYTKVVSVSLTFSMLCIVVLLSYAGLCLLCQGINGEPGQPGDRGVPGNPVSNPPNLLFLHFLNPVNIYTSIKSSKARETFCGIFQKISEKNYISIQLNLQIEFWYLATLVVSSNK